MRYNIDPHCRDSAWREIQPIDHGSVRWTYRLARRRGLNRADARLVIHSMFHLGFRTGHHVGVHQERARHPEVTS